jgi:hypothetical protein
MVTILSGCNAAILARSAAIRTGTVRQLKSPTSRKATELPSLVDHDQAIDAPHRYDVGVEVERLAELIISPLTPSPLGVRDARVRLDSSAARVRS